MARDSRGRFTSGSGTGTGPIVERLIGYVESVVRRLAVAIQANLQVSTPKDTGWASANWIGSIGTPSRAPDGTPGITGIPGSHTASGRAAASAAVIATWRLGQGNIWITNHVPYIGLLDRGSSAQAPSGFVRSSIIRAIDMVMNGYGGRDVPISPGARRRRGT